jgi:hypothetical protein
MMLEFHLVGSNRILLKVGYGDENFPIRVSPLATQKKGADHSQELHGLQILQRVIMPRSKLVQW